MNVLVSLILSFGVLRVNSCGKWVKSTAVRVNNIRFGPNILYFLGGF